MITLGAYEKCRLYIEEKTRNAPDQHKDRLVKEAHPCITISRETGAGAAYVSEKLIDYLQYYSDPEESRWTFFDKKLIEKVLEDHNLPRTLSEYMREDKYKLLSSAVYEMLGIHPSKWTLIQKTTESILQLARMGNVVIVGRAANIITSKLRNAFHVRLVAPLENRIQKMMTHYNMSEKEATEFIRKEDIARKNYVKSHFFKDVEDPTLYHLIVNTGLYNYEEAAMLIGNAVMLKFPRFFEHNKKK
ncbi:MAG: cytidylate kinase-like family protein [Ignavibacteriaceae bacterium]|nr:cytidylate kinase-like family protein [Ignavibacteriaceae bacterium]